ncbi:hypothetical protein V8E55_008977 [Tylopilus felleus]
MSSKTPFPRIVGRPAIRAIRMSLSPSSWSLGKHHNKTASLAQLVQLCETARAMGSRLVRFDTCCIHKTNMTQLSKAIHTVYNWYAQANPCIIHLTGSSSLTNFVYEPWIMRSWARFFGKGWRPSTALANDKDDEALMSALLTVTGIPRDDVVADNRHSIRGHAKARRIFEAGRNDHGNITHMGRLCRGVGRRLRAIYQCYSKWDGEGGGNNGVHVNVDGEPFTVTLGSRLDTVTALGVYGDITSEGAAELPQPSPESGCHFKTMRQLRQSKPGRSKIMYSNLEQDNPGEILTPSVSTDNLGPGSTSRGEVGSYYMGLPGFETFLL